MITFFWQNTILLNAYKNNFEIQLNINKSISYSWDRAKCQINIKTLQLGQSKLKENSSGPRYGTARMRPLD